MGSAESRSTGPGGGQRRPLDASTTGGPCRSTPPPEPAPSIAGMSAPRVLLAVLLALAARPAAAPALAVWPPAASLSGAARVLPGGPPNNLFAGATVSPWSLLGPGHVDVRDGGPVGT